MRHFGLIGHPLEHSFSKAYFTEKFKQEKWDCDYQNYDIEDLSLISSLELCGFNVTIPYKEAILPYLDDLDPIAAEVGAVNTVKALPDGRLKGYNTDVIGVGMTFQEETSILQSTAEALVLGTGGASKAIQYVLHKHSIPYHLVSRDALKGDFTYQDLAPEIIKSHLFIINTTPVGMAPHTNEAPNLPYETITPQHTLFDLIYNPSETLFLRYGRERGACTINGLEMLHAQAKASWTIWNQQ